MDLDISWVSDDAEEDPGGYIILNDCDDNGDGNPDKDDVGPVSGKDDLVAISLSYEPSDLSPGSVELKLIGDNIRVWNASNKGILVLPDDSNSYKRWHLG